MKTTHTPGPWNVVRNHAGTAEEVWSEDAWIATLQPRAEPAQEVANARLIASAPDLLAALREIVDCCTPVMNGSAERAKRIARAALAKVEG